MFMCIQRMISLMALLLTLGSHATAQTVEEAAKTLYFEENRSFSVFVESGGTQKGAAEVMKNICGDQKNIGNAIFVISKEGKEFLIKANISKESLINYLRDDKFFEKFLKFEVERMKLLGANDYIVGVRLESLVNLRRAVIVNDKEFIILDGEVAVTQINLACKRFEERKNESDVRSAVAIRELVGGFALVGGNIIVEVATGGLGTAFAAASITLGGALSIQGYNELKGEEK